MILPHQFEEFLHGGGSRSSNCLHLQVEVDGGKVEVIGEWNLASTLLPVTINGTDRTLQVGPRCPCHPHLPANTHTCNTCINHQKCLLNSRNQHFNLPSLSVSVQRCFWKDRPAVPWYIGKAACLLLRNHTQTSGRLCADHLHYLFICVNSKLILSQSTW